MSELNQNPPHAYEVQTGDFSREFVEKISKAQDEPRWMRERRLEAYGVYECLPIPKTPNEDTWKRTTDIHVQDYWRRTDLRMLKLQAYQPIALSPSDLADRPPLSDSLKAQMQVPEESGRIVLQDGVVVDVTLSQDLARKGVYFADLNTALQERPDLVESYFMTKAVTVDWNKFDALHGAFWQGGYLLHIPRGVVVEIPLRAFVVLSEPQRADLAHGLIIAEADSQVTLLEEHLSTDANAPGLHCGVVEIFVGDNAHINYVQLQNWNHRVWNFSTQRAIVGRDAQFRWVAGELGSRVSKLHQVSVLEGAGSNVEMLGLTFTHARQHIDTHTYQEHKDHHTTSDLLYRTVLKDRSHTVWNGMIHVHHEGQYTDAYQKNDNLLLSERARADTNPGLEILANEVRCTHGATAGPIDKDQVFYLMSRGLSYNQAERLIVDGFFEPVMQRIPLESVREQLQQSINRKLAI
ncbi:MAG: Fe-S cluster assembly protein SufD [Candidatus Poribacteria bacterium]|nr:Fe-S cluster assembly protein SufD [Candidatus Poribacteria bacterium]